MTTLFAKHILSVPTVSGKEDFFIDCIEKWCKIVGIKCHQDGKGNLYLVKGDASSAKWTPCLISHLDTVHRKYLPYIQKRELLPVQIDGDRLYIDGMGIGADCKAGVAICLSVMRKVKSCKCALFVEEETGMQGSKACDASFFDNVSYILSWDSPGGNRATRACSGVPMFTEEFFKIIEPIYKSHGITNWNSEPWTDQLTLVKRFGICSVNARNGGGMAAHTDREDCSLKDMNDSEQLCLDALAEIPCDRKWEIKYEEPKWERPEWSSYPGKAYGGKLSKEPDLDADEDFGSYVDELFGLDGSDDWQSYDDASSEDAGIQPENLDDDAEEEEKQENPKQMDLFDWIDQQK